MKNRRLEDMSEKRWDLACTAASSFICVVGGSVMIRFPRKMHLCFNHPCDPTVGSRSLKVGSLKYFEICGIQEKELQVSR
jgi:hypothetical protein